MNAITSSALLLAALTGVTFSAKGQAPRSAPAQASAPLQAPASTQAPAPDQPLPPGEASVGSANIALRPESPSVTPAPASPMNQPAATYQPQQPALVYLPAQPPQSPREPKVGVRLHDGLYLRMSVGMGPGQGKYKYTDATPGIALDEYKFSGFGVMFDIMVGGSPIPGWVLGGAFVGHTIIDPKVKLNNVDINTGSNQYTYNLSTFGLFTSVYPDPKAGLNFHGLVGLGTLSVKAGDATVTPEPAGPSFMGGVGYEFWIADQWSMGPDFRLAYCTGTSKSGVISHEGSLIMPTISFVATLH